MTKRKLHKGAVDSLLLHIVQQMDELMLLVKHDHESRRPDSCLATIKDLNKLERHIMTAIETLRDYAPKQAAFNTRLDSSITGLAGDIDNLNKIITDLQNSSGAVTPEDQALIDNLVVAGEALAARIESVDALTPPVAPPPPGTHTIE